MASRKIIGSKPNCFYPLKTDTQIMENDINLFEFDESEVWSHNTDHQLPTTTESKIPNPKKVGRRTDSVSDRRNIATAASLPVNVPDWSKILKQEYNGNGNGHGYDHDTDDEAGDGDRTPPHEYLARRRGASFSVHEGIGRTLKGRDLRCVRNAIWAKTGFQD